MKKRVRKYILIFLIFLVPVGLGSKFYHGVLELWVQNSLVGIWYVLFWDLFWFFWFPEERYLFRIVTGVLLVTSLLEVLQLWHPYWLEVIRSHFLGRTLLGTSFAWWDFVHYFLGTLLAWAIMLGLLRLAQRVENS